MSFQDDIQGQNTQLYPIVTIEPVSITVGQLHNPFENSIFLSTNNISLSHPPVGNSYIAQEDFKNPYYFKPLLLNIPSIKESIDIESGKFKISNVSLDISNIEYEGKRFTDILSDTSLINFKVSIQFVSPSVEFFSTILNIGYIDGVTDTSFYEAYTKPVSESSGDYADQSIRDKMTQMVYQGIIRRISHDDTKVKIELEDLTEKLAHKDLPQKEDQNGVVGYLGGGDSIPDKYKNKPIPMVYGIVDKSPLVISNSFSKYQADSRDIKEFKTTYSGFRNTSDEDIYLDPLQVDIDGEIHYVVRGGQYAAPAEGESSIELLPDILSGISLGAEDVGTGFDQVTLACRQIARPIFSITNTKHDSTLLGIDYLDIGYTQANINAITDGSDDTNDIGLLGQRNSENLNAAGEGNASNNEKLLLSLNFDVTPRHDTVDGNNKIIGFKVNGHNLPNLLGDKVLKVNHHNGLKGTSGDATSVSPFYDSIYELIWREDCPHADIIQEVFGFLSYGAGGNVVPPDGYDGSTADIKFNFYDIGYPSNYGLDMPVVLFSGGIGSNGYVNNTFAIQFRTVGDYQFPAGDSFAYHRVDITGNIDEISLIVENDAVKLFNNDFYANVKGRIQTYDDHPDEDMNYAEGYMGTEIIDLGIAGEIVVPVWIPPVTAFIENPIDIIYDLVRSELGHDAIDEAEYKEAKAAHDGWKFGFTVNKKINSKKLIEDIARSTKCFPKFKNDGTFGFNTIKDSYTVSDIVDDVEKGDYENAHLIKESEVISYSFKKTKPEQIHRKVTVAYNKDYAQDSYLKNLDIGGDLVAGQAAFNEYYGITDTGETVLEFESPYIRSEEGYDWTALYLRNFLLAQYGNDHLLFNVKLPLQYINLEIGDLVKFRDLFQGVKAYGIDYRRIEAPNGQYYYPLFMVTATTKNLDSVSIECMQLHHLSDNAIDSAWLDGTDEGDTEGEFYFPDADTIVIPPALELTPFANTFLDSIDIAPNTTVLFKLQPDDYYGTTPQDSDNSLGGLMNLNKFSPNLTESFNVDDVGDGIISSYQGTHEQPFMNNAPTMIADVESWYSVPELPYVAMKMEFVNDFQNESWYIYWLGDINASNERHDMNMFFMGGDVGNTDQSTIIENPESGSLLAHLYTHCVKLTNYSSETITFTPYAPLEYIAALPAANPFQPSPPYTGALGDANLDGDVNVLDVVLMVQNALGNNVFDEQQFANADINDDETVNVLDIVTLVNYIVDN